MAAPRKSYLMKPGVIEVILGSFLILTIPLLLCYVNSRAYEYAAAPNFSDMGEKTKEAKFNYVLNFYFVCLGMSHFFVTVAVYFNRANLKFFFSNITNTLIYIVIPLAMIVGIFCFYQLKIPERTALVAPILAPIVFMIIRLADFMHVQRQSYGVLQLLKGSSGISYANLSRAAEKLFFPTMAFAGWIAFMSTVGRSKDAGWKGIVDSTFYKIVNDQLVLVVVLAVAGVLFLFSMLQLINVPQKGTTWRQRNSPTIYFLFQSLSISMAVIDSRLYVVGLAMHYTEYHLLMYQRSFKAEGSLFRTQQVSRGWRVLLVVAFYTVLLGITMMFGLNQKFFSGHLVTSSMSNVFIGITVLHFYIEALIWRFRVPHFRKNLGPVYFNGSN